MVGFETRLVTITLVLVTVSRLDDVSVSCLFDERTTNPRIVTSGLAPISVPTYDVSSQNNNSHHDRSVRTSSLKPVTYERIQPQNFHLKMSTEEINSAYEKLHAKKLKASGVITDSKSIVPNYWQRHYRTEERGWPLSGIDYAVYLLDESGTLVSPFHDVSMTVDMDTEDPLYHMVVEIPRGSNAKTEISKERQLNPIGYSMRKFRPRFVSNIFPHNGFMWNYGTIPQTWLDPEVTDSYTGLVGESDSVDAIEIGPRRAEIGTVLRVKLLGIVPVIDRDMIDWKVVVIDVDGPMSGAINDLADVRYMYPGLLEETVKWLKAFKMPDGMQPNSIGMNGRVENAYVAKRVLDNAHAQWEIMMNRVGSYPARNNTTLGRWNPKWTVSTDIARNSMHGIDLRLVDRWQYIL